jgi:hypothetical protein
MIKMVRNEDAFTGLEAAIVLIAFIVVAAVFSYVMLGAGFFATGEAQRAVGTGVAQASSNLELSGPVDRGGFKHHGRKSGIDQLLPAACCRGSIGGYEEGHLHRIDENNVRPTQLCR